MDGPAFASLHPAADRALRGPLNGFAGAFAGGRRRVSDTSATGVSDTARP